MTPEKWEEICQKEPRYRDKPIRFVEGKITLTFPVCIHLGKNVSAYRKICLKGYTNPDGVGVKPCCDCGPGKCNGYVGEDPL